MKKQILKSIIIAFVYAILLGTCFLVDKCNLKLREKIDPKEYKAFVESLKSSTQEDKKEVKVLVQTMAVFNYYKNETGLNINNLDDVEVQQIMGTIQRDYGININLLNPDKLRK